MSGMSMIKACAELDVPSLSAIYQKMARDEEFNTIIARAREIQQHTIMDGIVEMADAATPEDWQVVKMRIWTRQWHASKLVPRVYGDKLQHANAAGDGNLTINVNKFADSQSTE